MKKEKQLDGYILGQLVIPVEFLHPQLIGTGEKLRRMFMEPSQEYESVIPETPLQFN